MTESERDFTPLAAALEAASTIGAVGHVRPDGDALGAAVGLAPRWGGHVAMDESQPRWGFWPLGSLNWYRWFDDEDLFMIIGNEVNAVAEDLSGRTLEIGVEYMWRVRVETAPGGETLTSFKAWKSAETGTAATASGRTCR